MTKIITGKTQLLGVIGHPVGHSLSPVMHNAALTKLGLDYVYLPFPIAPDNLEMAIAGFAAVGVVGFSVTIPHKQAIIPFLKQVSPIAEAIGAVNTVTRQGCGWVGTNTDVEGFIAPLKSTYQQDWQGKTAVILGNGGAARAVVAGCVQLGLTKIHVVGRNLQKLVQFAKSWQNSPFTDKFQVHIWEDLPKLMPEADLLVNTTPLGMYPHAEVSPVSEAELQYLPSGAIAYDLIYIPQPTRFLQLAAKQGAIAIDGLEMLVQQGAAALKIWLQQENVPVEEMRYALKSYLALG
ncbi:MAG TPA: shikimate dehydrogenase [Nostocaceae cyanobacterium]|nr:shikimate dehydrogenase [Nostocaceae cyanobacterium]